jgi:hypothetical protein
MEHAGNAVRRSLLDNPDFDHSDWESGVGGVGYEAASALPRIRTLADSEADWGASGEQGLHGWLAGYYQPAIDPDRGFDFRRDFELDPNVWHFHSGALDAGRSRCSAAPYGLGFL